MLLNSKEEIELFIKLSNALGTNKAYIQGAGGNTSIKLDNSDVIAIKASGHELCNITATTGLSYVNYKDVVDYYSKNNPTDSELNEEVYKNSSQFNQQKPSIETLFHCLIKNKSIVHTHSVYVNVLSCAKNGYNICKDIFGSKHDFIWVPYKTPGIELASEINKELSKQNVKIIILENHGIIVAHDSMIEAIKLHDEINKVIISHFNLPDFVLNKKAFDIKYARDNILFPDQIVYTKSDAFLNTKSAQEVLNAYFYIIENIKNSKLEANFLPLQNIDIISNMDSEKHRQKLIKN
jgi:ribulose-5-phosphate 4-epimerase/fuculose-1-phosphate aldolase